MDPVTQRIIAVFAGLILLTGLGGMIVIALVRDGSTVDIVIQALVALLSAAVGAATGMVAFVMHVKNPTGGATGS